ncbi:MAG TPA: hypothetical protein DDZ80_07925 [Cyanobacteria bacterium UBA8803]|nr:hypothetical protein [Cyanobacteria bacterium UBA8803]
MNLGDDWDSPQLQVKLEAIKAEIWALAKTHEGNSLALLALLRTLEQAHREVREGFFQASLPDSRHAFYALLRDIQESGGWPYIEKMKLRSLLENLLGSEVLNPAPPEANDEA